MAKLAVNTFTCYELTERETLEGSILNQQQKQLIQTELSEIANQILALDYTPTATTEFIQHEAFLKGQMSYIRVLLERSEVSQKLIQSLSNNSHNS